jgi:Protein of unknown function (DUF3426)
MLTQCSGCSNTFLTPKINKRAKKTPILCSDCKRKLNAPTLSNEKPKPLVTEAKAEYIAKPETNRKPSPKKKSENLANLISAIGLLKKTISNAAAKNTSESDPDAGRLPWEIEKKAINVNWFIGAIIGLVLLFGQFIYFEGGKLSQNIAYRPALEKLCQWLSCQLADYENLAEFAVLQGSFTPNADNTISFKAVIANQAGFKQKLPNIKLILRDYNEQLIAQRIFSPKDYLVNTKRTNNSIAADETVEVGLTIAAPKTPIGGYNFDLIY